MADAAGAKEPPGAPRRPAAPKRRRRRRAPHDRHRDEALLPALRGLLPRGRRRPARPGVLLWWRRAARGNQKRYRRPRRLVAACCLGCWYTMLCWTPAGAEAPKEPAEAPRAEGMDRV